MKVRDVLRLLRGTVGTLPERVAVINSISVRYVVVLEPTETGFSACVPDLPGCAAKGETQSDVEANLREAIQLHLDGLREEGVFVPAGQSIAMYVEDAA